MDNFSKKSVRTIINADAAYEILDNSNADGSTWCAGGCAILAFALNMAFGFPVYVIYNYTDDQTEHFGVKTSRGAYIDCDGEQYEWLRNFRRKDFYLHPNKKLGIIPHTNETKTPDIVVDMEASKKLANLFKPQPQLSTNQTLHEGLFI